MSQDHRGSSTRGERDDGHLSETIGNRSLLSKGVGIKGAPVGGNEKGKEVVVENPSHQTLRRLRTKNEDRTVFTPEELKTRETRNHYQELLQ